MAVYRFKNQRDKAAVYSAGGSGRAEGSGRARAPAARHSYGGKPAAASKTVPDKAARKKRVIKAYMVRKTVDKMKEKRDAAAQGDKASAQAMQQAADSFDHGAKDTAVFTAYGVYRTGKAARTLYRKARALYEGKATAAGRRMAYREMRRNTGGKANGYRAPDKAVRGKRMIKLYMARKLARKMQQKKAGAPQAEKASAQAVQQANDSFNRGVRRTAVGTAYAAYRVGKAARALYKARRDAAARTLYGGGHTVPGQAVYAPSGTAHPTNGLYGARPKAGTVRPQPAAQRVPTVRYRTAMQQASGKRSPLYRLRAQQAGIRKLKRQQAERLAQTAGRKVSAAAGKGILAAGRLALEKAAALLRAKLAPIAAAAALLLCMAMAPIGVFASAAGILFADENANTTTDPNVYSVQQAYTEAQMAWQAEVLRGESYHRVEYHGVNADNVEVLAVFAVKVTEQDKLDAMTMAEKQRQVLAGVYNDMNPYRKWIQVVDDVRILHVEISPLSADAAADKYRFKKDQRVLLHDLLDEYRPDLLALLSGFSGGGAAGYPGAPIEGDAYEALMDEAQKYVGWPYVYGGSSPSTSFDCSGFICWVYTQSGVYNLPRTTAQGIYGYCKPVSPSEAQPGDLVFFENTYNFHERITHIGIYVGNGKMLHAGNPIGYADITSSFWQSHFYGFGRLGN